MAENKNLKDRNGRGGKDQRDRADEKIGSGPHGAKKPKTQPSGSDDGGKHAHRGMTSEGGAKLWEKTGFNVPTDVHGKHHPGGKKK